MEITMVMSGDHLLMIEHIISMEYIVIILYRYYYNIGGFTAKRTQPINRIPFGFSTTDLNGDGSGFRMLTKVIVIVFQVNLGTMIVCLGMLPLILTTTSN
jgi:hypothetical protein